MYFFINSALYSLLPFQLLYSAINFIFMHRLKGLSHEIDFKNVDENDRSWP